MSKLLVLFWGENGWMRNLWRENIKCWILLVNRLQSEKDRAAATAQAEAQSQARSEVSRILSAERALAQENLQEAIVRERLTTEDARRRTELFVSVLQTGLLWLSAAVSLYGNASLFYHMVPLKEAWSGWRFASCRVTDVRRVHGCILMSSHSFIHPHVSQSAPAWNSWLCCGNKRLYLALLRQTELRFC